jgi:SAM-dependent methyltransferase
LQGLSDVELLKHFENYSHERRIYGMTQSTTQLLSMRWLRGKGIEIGAGRYKTPLYGNADSLIADCNEESVYGTKAVELEFSIEDRNFSNNHKGRFDFVIASHVLEHTDSLLRSLENLLAIAKFGGIVYIVLPDIRFLIDNNWMPNFDFNHHVLEYENPKIFNYLHDELFIDGLGGDLDQLNSHADLDESYKAALISRNIPSEMRYEVARLI